MKLEKVSRRGKMSILTEFSGERSLQKRNREVEMVEFFANIGGLLWVGIVVKKM